MLAPFLLAVPVLLAACGGSPSGSASSTSTTAGRSTTTSTSATTTSAAAPTTTTVPVTTTTSAAVTGSTLPMQTANGGEFLSPSGNISCEVDYHYAGLTGAGCQTLTPPRSVKMTPAGTLTTCTGQQCLGNPGLDTPTLDYGEVTGVGPYRCVSSTTGITCTVNGKGFHIARSGITPATTG